MKVYIVIFLVFLMQVGKSQSVSGLKQFGPNVAIRVYEIASIVNLNEEKQVKLAKYFSRQYDHASAALNKGESFSSIQSFFRINADTLNSILTPLEVIDYYSLIDEARLANKPEVSKLRGVLRLRKELTLQSEQIDTLLSLCKKSEHLLLAADVEASAKIDATAIKLILSREQGLVYFGKLEQQPTRKTANKWLSQLISYKIIRAQDTADVYPIVFAYESNKNANLDYLQFIGATKEYDLKKNSIDLDKPDFLLKLEAFRNAALSPRLANVIFNRKELGLKGEQIDSLLSSFRRYNKMVVDAKLEGNNTDLKKFEWSEILKFLSPDQCTLYVIIFNREHAVKIADQDIVKLAQYKLLKHEQESKVKAELTNFRLKDLCCNTWLEIEKSRKNTFAKQDVVENRPEILKQLEVAIKAEKESKVVKF